MSYSLLDAEEGGQDPERYQRTSITGGLSSAEAERRIQKYGKNEIPEKKTPLWQLFLMQFVGPMPFMLEACIVVSIVVAATGQESAIEDAAIIAAMVLINACIGFYEERKAQVSLDGLKDKMATTVNTIRDGKPIPLDVALLVPGDIISLRGGNAVPADCSWVEGDTVKVDTASLTGEPIPWNVPRPDKSGEPGSGKKMLGGYTVVQGECFCQIEETGLETEIGKAAELIMANAGHQMGYFESKIMGVVNIVIFFTLIIAAVIFCYDVFALKQNWPKALLSILSLIIGAVPIALPLVIQVTMAIGAGTMARYKAIITHLTALQEIASMTVLNSDKTGTLTTAKMSIIKEKIWCMGNYSREQLLTYAALASNAANLDDPIDRAIIQAAREGVPDFDNIIAEYKKTHFAGFNAIVKRAVGFYDHAQLGKLKICKGLIDKVLATGADGDDTWTVQDHDQIRPEVKNQDLSMSEVGYKTIGMAISINDSPMEFIGIVPMLDPPRHDTKITIHRIRKAGIEVKMITGDHLNIAKETARLIDLGVNIYPNTALHTDNTASRNELIMQANGFAQVLPTDKQEIVLVEQEKGLVVGMTGDGVNDAAALSQAQVGIAVSDATDAARNASDMILTEPGLSAIYTAVVESRKIFQRLKAYVLYRMAATVQIVLVLVVLAFVDHKEIVPIQVVLLALLNDISLTPISNDNAVPSPEPDVPTLGILMFYSLVLGLLLTGQSLLFWYEGDSITGANFHDDAAYCKQYPLYKACYANDGSYSPQADSDYATAAWFECSGMFATSCVSQAKQTSLERAQDIDYDGTKYTVKEVGDMIQAMWDEPTTFDLDKACGLYKATAQGNQVEEEDCGWKYRSTLLYIQISVAVEFLILGTRTNYFFFMSCPSVLLLVGIFGANLAVSVLAVTPTLWTGACSTGVAATDSSVCYADKHHASYPGLGEHWSDYLGHQTGYPNASIAWSDLGWVWLYDIIWLFIIDAIKILAFWAMGELKDGVLDPGGDVLQQDVAVEIMDGRVSEMSARGAPQQIVENVRASLNRGSIARNSIASRPSQALRGSMGGRDSISRGSYVRPSIGNSLRPSNPANVAQLIGAGNNIREC